MNGRLSTEQRAAAEANANHLLILASPGCGKTEVLAHRAAHLIHQLLPNQRILALTFTNRAKVNLSQRFRETLGATRMRKYVVVKNFHGHAADTILAHGRTLPDRPDRMSLPTRSTAGKDLERVVPDTSERAAAVDLLGQVKSSPLSDDEIITRLQDSDDPGAASALEVEQIRQEAMRLDYDDLLRHAQRILRVSAVARLYQCHFGAILVDEFQDMSLQHLDLVRRTCTASRTYAGDPDQGIFTWAGAAPKQVLKALREECSEPLRLHGSYRSSPQVLSMVNEISAHLSSNEIGAHLSSPVPLDSVNPMDWPDGGCSAKLEFPDKKEEADGLLRLAEAVLKSSPDNSFGVITRAGWRRRVIDRTFTGSELPVRRWDLAVDDPSILERIREVVNRLPRNVTVKHAREAVLSGADPADVDTVDQLEDAFDILSGTDAPSIRAALGALRTSDPLEPVGSGVHLLNAHTGKGQQFDWVVVVGMEEGHLPSKKAKTRADLAEEERTLLVMLSRARHGVVATRTRKDVGPSQKVSRWWSLLTPQYTTLAMVFEHIERLT